MALGTTPLMLAVLVGAAQNIMSKVLAMDEGRVRLVYEQNQIAVRMMRPSF